MIFGTRELVFGLSYVCLRDSIFSLFGTIPACDTQTDDDSIYRANIASRGKKN